MTSGFYATRLHFHDHLLVQFRKTAKCSALFALEIGEFQLCIYAYEQVDRAPTLNNSNSVVGKCKLRENYDRIIVIVDAYVPRVTKPKGARLSN